MRAAIKRQRKVAARTVEEFIQHGRISFHFDPLLAGTERQNAEESASRLDPEEIPLPVIRLNLVDGVAVPRLAGEPERGRLR